MRYQCDTARPTRAQPFVSLRTYAVFSTAHPQNSYSFCSRLSSSSLPIQYDQETPSHRLCLLVLCPQPVLACPDPIPSVVHNRTTAIPQYQQLVPLCRILRRPLIGVDNLRLHIEQICNTAQASECFVPLLPQLCAGQKGAELLAMHEPFQRG